jgi:hypothetical protein
LRCSGTIQGSSGPGSRRFSKLKRGHKSDEAIKQSLLEKYGPLLEGYYEPEMVAHEIGMNAEGVLQYLGSSGRASKSGSGPRP